MKKRIGFTLIELLISMLIIGILATLIGANYINIKKKGRDAQRKHDLGQIQEGLEMYYNDNGKYPDVGDLPAWGSPWLGAGGIVYMKEVPRDPKPDQTYIYDQRDGGTGYALYARIENEKDLCFDTGACKDYGLDCNTGLNCNYAVSSPNVSL